LLDEEVQKKAGIYSYLFDDNLSHLNLRQFPEKIKIEVFEKQNGICPQCEIEKKAKTKYNIDEMDADHITP